MKVISNSDYGCCWFFCWLFLWFKYLTGKKLIIFLDRINIENFIADQINQSILIVYLNDIFWFIHVQVNHSFIDSYIRLVYWIDHLVIDYWLIWFVLDMDFFSFLEEDADGCLFVFVVDFKDLIFIFFSNKFHFQFVKRSNRMYHSIIDHHRWIDESRSSFTMTTTTTTTASELRYLNFF